MMARAGGALAAGGLLLACVQVPTERVWGAGLLGGLAVALFGTLMLVDGQTGYVDESDEEVDDLLAEIDRAERACDRADDVADAEWWPWPTAR